MQFNIKNLTSTYLNLVNNLVFSQTHVPVIGIDIGTGTVKAVILAKASANIELNAWAIVPIENNDIKAAITAVLAKIKYTDQPIVTAVSGKGTLIRYVDMPRIPLEDLRKSFVYDLDKYFPFEPETIYSDCFILDGKSKEKRMNVLIAGVKKDMVDERVALFKSLGAELSQITINSIATANAFERLGPVKGAGAGATAVLDIGCAVSNIMVIKDGAPCFTRDIFIGSHEMTQQIGNILGVSVAEAETLKQSPGAREAEVKEACEAAVSHLVSEIRLSLDYFMTEKNIQIDEFYLLGGGALLKGIESIVEKNLGIPVKHWDMAAGIKINSSQPETDFKASAAQLVVAIGLGLTKV